MTGCGLSRAYILLDNMLPGNFIDDSLIGWAFLTVPRSRCREFISMEVAFRLTDSFIIDTLRLVEKIPRSNPCG